MLFNSHIFLFLFLPMVWVLFQIISAFRALRVATGLLVVASLVFYAYWNPPFVLLILFSIGFNYAVGHWIGRTPSRWPLGIGIAVNLGLIGYFKYAGFFTTTLASILHQDWTVPSVFLPLGISFFTFQQIAYLIERHRRLIENTGFLQYCLFVTFFPQLIAGPIVHFSQMVPQFERRDTFRFNADNVAAGLALLSMGLFKKVIIADTLSPWVGELFEGGTAPALFAAWMGTLSYALQIYFDFSGYSEMAIGLGRLFNIDIPVNFNSPYKSTSPVDFWRRWHMTLSAFLKDYLYIPLGGNRKGEPRRYVNLMATMLLGGLWHGAAWTFVLWGGIHGLLLCVNNAWRKLGARFSLPSIPAPAAWLMTFVCIIGAWVVFRAATMEKAAQIYSGMIGLNGVEPLVDVIRIREDALLSFLPINERLFLLMILLVIVVAAPNALQWNREKLAKHPVVAGMVSGVLLLTSIMGMSRISEFLYFQF